MLLNGCKLGKNPQNVDLLSSALSSNTSIRGIELNNNYLTDAQGVTLLQPILNQVMLGNGQEAMYLHKLCIKDNLLGDKSA